MNLAQYTHHSWLNLKLESRDTGNRGRGVFAREKINKGEKLAIFGGEIFHIDAVKNLPKELQPYVLQIDEYFVIGNSVQPETTDYFNHSCEPNAGMRGQILLVAMRDILAKEEIVFDYAMVVSESPGSDVIFEMDCMCGTKNCRKKITEYDWKRSDLMERYHGYFSQYLQDKINLLK